VKDAKVLKLLFGPNSIAHTVVQRKDHNVSRQCLYRFTTFRSKAKDTKMQKSFFVDNFATYGTIYLIDRKECFSSEGTLPLTADFLVIVIIFSCKLYVLCTGAGLSVSKKPTSNP